MSRPPASPILLSCALGAALMLTACHKKPIMDAADASSHRLTVESYDAPIPKAPLKGKKLETMIHPPVMTPPPVSDSPAASSEG